MPSLQVFSNCKRCGRALKNQKAQAVGYGTTCLKKHKAETEHLLKTGQELREGGQSSLTHFLSYADFKRTPELRRVKKTTC